MPTRRPDEGWSIPLAEDEPGVWQIAVLSWCASHHERELARRHASHAGRTRIGRRPITNGHADDHPRHTKRGVWRCAVTGVRTRRVIGSGTAGVETALERHVVHDMTVKQPVSRTLRHPRDVHRLGGPKELGDDPRAIRRRAPHVASAVAHAVDVEIEPVQVERVML